MQLLGSVVLLFISVVEIAECGDDLIAADGIDKILIFSIIQCST